MASIRKRKWKDKRGTEQTAWVVDYFDQSGARHLKTFRTKKEADDWRSTAVIEVRQGIHTPSSSSKTVAEAWALWIAHCEAENLERSTIRQRQQHLNLHIKPFIGSVKLSDLTTPRVKTFLNDLREAGRSLQMRRKVLTNLKTTLSFAQGEGLVAQNVALAVRIKDDTREGSSGPLRAGIDFPTRSEMNAAIDRAPVRWRPFAARSRKPLQYLNWTPKRLQTVMGHSSVRMTFDLYGHLFEDTEKDRADMAKIEAAVRAA